MRHGESMGNVADAQRPAVGAGRLKLDVRDPDVPLSDTGRAQAEALGTWLAELPEDERPTAALSSPFNRALTTAQLATEKLGIRVRTDERLRERDFGAFDGMTGAGHPRAVPRRGRSGATCSASSTTGRPAGESWADVALRIRSLLATEGLRHDCERLLIVAHQAVIMVFRYVLEELTEQELLAVDKEEQVANASLTRYERDADGNLRARPRSTRSSTWSPRPRSVTEEPDAAPQPLSPRSSPPQVLRGWPLPEPTGGKNARGSILVIGGSTETLGAVAAGRRGRHAGRRGQAAGGHGRLAGARSPPQSLPEALVRGAAGDRRRRDQRRRGRRGARPGGGARTPSSSGRAWPTRRRPRRSASGCCRT